MPYLISPRLATPQLLEAYQGAQTDSIIYLKKPDGTAAAAVFTAGTALTCSVWQGQNQSILCQPAVSWWTGTTPAQTGYDVGQVLFSPNAADLTFLDPAGEYRLQVYATTSGERVVAADCGFKVLAAPGFTSPAPPDLISYDYCLSQLTGITLTTAQRDNLPSLVSAASQAIRTFCFDRYFDLRTLTETYDVEQDGTVRLYQVPIQVITRVQGQPVTALTVSNNSQSVQTAQAYFTFTGTTGGYGTNAKTATGIMLTWTSSGFTSSQGIPFTSNETVSAVANAINAVGSGWVATVNSGYASWAATELTGGFVGQGCALSAVPSDGAQFSVLLDLTDTRLDNPDRGFLWVGQQGSNINAGRWGPGGDELFGWQDWNWTGQVKVTYQAGFAVIPPQVQYFAGQLVHWYLVLAKQDLMLIEEKAADYSYRVSEKMLVGMPDAIRQGLSVWRLHFA